MMRPRTSSRGRNISASVTVAVVLQVVTSSVMDQFKEIPLLECLLNFQKDVFCVFIY